jgi:hypothetical protein
MANLEFGSGEIGLVMSRWKHVGHGDSDPDQATIVERQRVLRKIVFIKMADAESIPKPLHGFPDQANLLL